MVRKGVMRVLLCGLLSGLLYVYAICKTIEASQPPVATLQHYQPSVEKSEPFQPHIAPKSPKDNGAKPAESKVDRSNASTGDRIPKHCAPCKAECKRGWWRRCSPCPPRAKCDSFCKDGTLLRKRRYGKKITEKFPLHHAIRERWPTDRVERLLDSDEISVNDVDDERRTALHWAASFAYPELVELLLLKGADVDKRDFRGNTPLHLVIKRYTPRPGDRRRVIDQLLYDGASMYDRNFIGNNAFDAAYNSFNQRYALHTSMEQL